MLERLGLGWADLFPPRERRNGHQHPEKGGRGPAAAEKGPSGWPDEDAAFGWLHRKCGVPRVMATGLGVRFQDGALCLTWPAIAARMVRRGPGERWLWEAEEHEGRRPDLWPLPIFPPRTIWLTEGATDTLALRAAGLPAYASVKGASRDLRRAFRALREAGVDEVVLAFDIDTAGRDGAEKAEKAAAEAGLRMRRLELPQALALAGGKDICDLLATLGGSPKRLREVAEGLAREAPVPDEGGPFGFVPTIYRAVGTKREARAAELQARAKEGGASVALPSLPLLGQGGVILKGLSHLLSGYPKAGKTELLARAVAEWQGETVLWLTEEPESIWEARLARLPESYSHVTLYFALGCRREELLERIAGGDETVVILDTSKLLGLEDTNDAAEVTRVLTPLIATCRERGKTLVLVHHERKGGGQHGEGISGSHAFLGLVDVALELLRDDKSPNRRLLRGYGRVVPIRELAYEMGEDGSLLALGDPTALALLAVQERARALLTEEWQTLGDIMAAMGDPKPSDEQVRRALNALVEGGLAERDPPPGVKGNRAHRWRLRFGFVPTAQSLIGTKPNDGRPGAGEADVVFEPEEGAAA
ncbi:MAG: AAA family ATPase [Dehalococcoidia bacterium]|nr:AAA family ATPase [Dehalococcoidia bacterium]